ncbi:MAG: rod shape-determining protein [Acidobacteria bacterium]|nr:rod shape-determining protein [Acidobacteriota bacterium]
MYERGLYVTGGGALLSGIGDFLQRETSLSTHVVAEPRHSCVNGLLQLFDDARLLRRVSRSEPSLLLDAESAALP